MVEDSIVAAGGWCAPDPDAFDQPAMQERLVIPAEWMDEVLLRLVEYRER